MLIDVEFLVGKFIFVSWFSSFSLAQHSRIEPWTAVSPIQKNMSPNPPLPHDEESNDLDDLLTTIAADDRCTAILLLGDKLQRCILVTGHEQPHRSISGRTWEA
jgi:hypothetical protein